MANEKSPAVILKTLSHFADLQLRNKYFGRRWFVGGSVSVFTDCAPLVQSVRNLYIDM